MNSLVRKLLVDGVFGSVLFDNLKVRFKLQHEPTAEFLPYLKGKKKTTRAAIKLVNWTGNSKLLVRSSGDGKFITVDGSYVKWLTGQNIVGTEGLIQLAFDVFQKVANEIGVKPTDCELDAVLAGEFELLRVDYTVNCDFGSEDEARAFQRKLKKLWCFSQSNYSHYRDVETLYVNQTGDRWTFKSYLKGAEVAAKGDLQNVNYGKQLTNIANRLVRLELTLRSKYLGENQTDRGIPLTSPKAWTVDFARAIFKKFSKKVFKNIDGMFVCKPNLERLTNRERLVLLVSASEFTLDGVIGARQIKQAKKSVWEKIGVDIFALANGQNSNLGLSKLSERLKERMVFRSSHSLYEFLRDEAQLF